MKFSKFYNDSERVRIVDKRFAKVRAGYTCPFQFISIQELFLEVEIQVKVKFGKEMKIFTNNPVSHPFSLALLFFNYQLCDFTFLIINYLIIVNLHLLSNKKHEKINPNNYYCYNDWIYFLFNNTGWCDGC